MYRWIMYVAESIPGNVSFELLRVRSLAEARDEFRKYCDDPAGSDDCHGTLYPYSPDRWVEAEEFRDVGCPFDYPSATIGRGPRGGVRIEVT